MATFFQIYKPKLLMHVCVLPYTRPAHLKVLFVTILVC